MNECPFCGMHLDCNSNDVWICEKCNESWIRRKSLEPSISQLPNFRVLVVMINEAFRVKCIQATEVTIKWELIKRKADEITEHLKIT